MNLLVWNNVRFTVVAWNWYDLLITSLENSTGKECNAMSYKFRTNFEAAPGEKFHVDKEDFKQYKKNFKKR